MRASAFVAAALKLTRDLPLARARRDLFGRLCLPAPAEGRDPERAIPASAGGLARIAGLALGAHAFGYGRAPSAPLTGAGLRPVTRLLWARSDCFAWVAQLVRR